MPSADLRRMLIWRASGIHDAPNHHHTDLSPRAVAYRFRRPCHFQCGILVAAIRASRALGDDIYVIRHAVMDPLLRGAKGRVWAGLVQTRLVLYPGIAAGGATISLQHDRLGAKHGNHMARDPLQADITERNSRLWWLRRKRKLNTIIFFVTSHCNATCETCFYWDELNQKGDLSWDEIVKLSNNTPQFTDLWFSGGEPTLRRELAEIIDLFVRNNGVRYINLPTNGLKPNRIYEVAEHVLLRNPALELHINIALDGLRESHDFMRGVPGNFERALESGRLLRRLKGKFGLRLIVNINTVMTRDNLDEILPLAELVWAERIADGHYFNLIRGDAKDPGLKQLEREKLRQVYAKLPEIQWHYAEGMFDDR